MSDLYVPEVYADKFIEVLGLKYCHDLKVYYGNGVYDALTVREINTYDKLAVALWQHVDMELLAAKDFENKVEQLLIDLLKEH